ncbi:MAG: hypothetical protein MJ007_02010 [Paludibacteraceae bacterium]|nr:hypothetical protein [Paludibacteraceae bacterium]
MDKTMTDRERTIITELAEVVNKLTAKDKEHLLWTAQGILLAGNNGK